MCVESVQGMNECFKWVECTIFNTSVKSLKMITDEKYFKIKPDLFFKKSVSNYGMFSYLQMTLTYTDNYL